MKKDFRSFIINIFSNLTTMFIAFFGPLIYGYFFGSSFESKLAFINMGLILFLISVIFNFRFTKIRPILVQPVDRGHVYLIENNTAKHVPDPPTLDYLGKLNGVNIPDIERITPEEFKRKYTTGNALPSILPYCVQYHKELCEAELQKSPARNG